jgi:hypothetical protein
METTIYATVESLNSLKNALAIMATRLTAEDHFSPLHSTTKLAKTTLATKVKH